MESDVITLQELFKFQLDEVTRDGTSSAVCARRAFGRSSSRSSRSAAWRCRSGSSRRPRRSSARRQPRGRRAGETTRARRCGPRRRRPRRDGVGCRPVAEPDPDRGEGPSLPGQDVRAAAAERPKPDDPQPRRDRERWPRPESHTGTGEPRLEGGVRHRARARHELQHGGGAARGRRRRGADLREPPQPERATRGDQLLERLEGRAPAHDRPDEDLREALHGSSRPRRHAHLRRGGPGRGDARGGPHRIGLDRRPLRRR